MASVWLLLSLMFSLRTGTHGTREAAHHVPPPCFAFKSKGHAPYSGVLPLRGGWGGVARGVMMPAEIERNSEDAVDRRGKGEWKKEEPMIASQTAQNLHSNAVGRFPKDVKKTDQGGSLSTSARRLGKRHVRERHREALRDMETEGVHLKPVGRSGGNIAKASQDILSWKEWETKTVSSTRVSRKKADGNANTTKHDDETVSGQKNITIPLPKLQVREQCRNEKAYSLPYRSK